MIITNYAEREQPFSGRTLPWHLPGDTLWYTLGD